MGYGTKGFQYGRNAVNLQDHKDLNNNPVRELLRPVLRNNLIQPFHDQWDMVRFYIRSILSD